jgi:hypothetical protein
MHAPRYVVLMKGLLRSLSAPPLLSLIILRPNEVYPSELLEEKRLVCECVYVCVCVCVCVCACVCNLFKYFAHMIWGLINLIS